MSLYDFIKDKMKRDDTANLMGDIKQKFPFLNFRLYNWPMVFARVRWDIMLEEEGLI